MHSELWKDSYEGLTFFLCAQDRRYLKNKYRMRQVESSDSQLVVNKLMILSMFGVGFSNSISV